MGLRNILAPTNQQQTSSSRALGGGILSLFEPGTTTFIQAFQDSSLAVPHTSPIRLSGSGRADVWINQDCDLQLTDRNGNLILFQENANPDSLGATATGSLLTNGSFEDDTNADGTPDSWVLVDEAGSTNARDTSESTDGGASFRFTSSGSGGGNLTSENFFPVNDVDQLRVSFDLRSTVAAVRNIFRVEWYDVSQISISDSDPYDSTANPATYTGFSFDVTPPALARFAKIKIIGIDPSVLLAGSTFVDNVQALYPAVVAGVFDNIEIRNNEIVSLNTNGEIDIKPDGTGPVNVISSNAVDLVDVNNPMNVGQLVGPGGNPHIAMDANQIQAKSDATNSTDLSINPLGGDVNLGSPGTTTTLQGGLEVDQDAFFSTFAEINNNDPRFIMDDGDSAANNRRWDLTGIADQLLLRLVDDADTGFANVMIVDRTLNVVDLVAFGGPVQADRLYLPELAAGGDVTDQGQLYVNASNELIYRSEGGTETNLLTAGGSVNISGTPVNNQVTVWTDANTIEGTVGLTFSGTGAASGTLQLFGSSAGLSVTGRVSSGATAFFQNDSAGAFAQALSLFKNVANVTSPVLSVTSQNATGNDRDAVGIYIDNEQGEAIEINFDSGGIILGESQPHHTHGITQAYGTIFCQEQINAGLGGQNKPMWRDGNGTLIAMLGIREDIAEVPPSGSEEVFSNYVDDPKKVTLLFESVGVSILTNIRIRVGDSTGGTDTVGYVGRSWATDTAGAVTTATFTDGYNIQLQSASSTLTGRCTFEKMEEGNDLWIVHGKFLEENAGSSFVHEFWGHRDQNDLLDRIVCNLAAGVWNAGVMQVHWNA